MLEGWIECPILIEDMEVSGDTHLLHADTIPLIEGLKGIYGFVEGLLGTIDYSAYRVIPDAPSNRHLSPRTISFLFGLRHWVNGGRPENGCCCPRSVNLIEASSHRWFCL